jgi:hypothetical protein
LQNAGISRFEGLSIGVQIEQYEQVGKMLGSIIASPEKFAPLGK